MLPSLNQKFKFFAVFGVLTFVSVVAYAKLDTQKKKMGYAIGQQIGEKIKSQGMEVDVDSMAKSIKDVLAGKKSEMSMEDMRKVMMEAQAEAQSKMTKMADENGKKGKEFLEANKKKPGIVTTPSGLQYKMIKEGTGDKPTDDDIVKCHYSGKLIDGTEFDSSYARKEPAEFPVTQVIKGWTEALKTMKAGEKRELFIPSELAYGPGGRPGIPPSSVLIFQIELIEIKKGAAKAMSIPGGPSHGK